MKLFRTATTVAAAVLLGATAVGCSNQQPADSDSTGSERAEQPERSGGSGDGNLTVWVVTHGRTGDPFWDIVKTGADDAGRELDVNVSYSGDGDPKRQAELIDSAVAEDVDGLVVSMANPSGLAESIRKAVRADIPVITINSGLEKSEEFGAITHVGQGERLAGEAAGEELAEHDLENVVCVVHEQGNIGLEERCAGAGDALGNELEPLVVDISNLAEAENTIQSKLQADPDVDGVLTLNPSVAKVAVQAREEAQSDAELATFDVSEDVAQSILDGDLLFAVDQQPYLQGYLPVVMLALKNRNGNEVGGGQPVYSGPGIVTEQNAAEVKRYAAEGTR